MIERFETFCNIPLIAPLYVIFSDVTHVCKMLKAKRETITTTQCSHSFKTLFMCAFRS